MESRASPPGHLTAKGRARRPSLHRRSTTVKARKTRK